MAVLGSLLKGSIKFTSTIQKIRKVKPQKWQKKAFTKLVAKARYTQFGEKYNFEEILSTAIFEKGNEFYTKFQESVPIYDYNKIYAEWWHKARNGEKNVCWPGRVKYFALSSGTSDAASKAIPVTKEMIKAIQRTSINQIIALGHYNELPSNIYEKGYLMLGGSTALNEVDSHYEGDLSGITTGTLPFWFQNFYKPGQKIAAEKNWANKLEEITENAQYWDIGFLAGVPAWHTILLEKIIKRYNLKNIHELWPNLTAFAWGGVSLEPYKQGLEKLFGKPVIYIETYMASEGFLAYQDRPDGHLRLVLNQGIFFEFIPFNENNFDEDGNVVDKPETLMVHQVQEDVDYALLISTCAGAWRYLIGDTVKFTNKARAEIKITGRTKHFLSLCGEHLSVDNMNNAIELVSKEMDIDVREFTVIGMKHPPLFAHQWYVATDSKVDENLLCELIDKKLCELNDDYAVERGHALKNVFLRVLPTSAFYEWMKQKGKEGGQHKFPRVLKGKQLEDWEEFVNKNYPKVGV
ncbi:GH3 auxin-responsive promoter family protein [Emticicia sp. 21SJ11W-3]|uniref:GH3 family domain-containing protein n=1 Tax=Emticicia sp. 21SJ11W-3 TaxID=2916755 RepID=UPI00209D6FF8|nr:GH3 auxin-responsive promoter family protein [Emticicia sp. 21SJ11W-3]UTA66165.1 GH3 auxin-responsive promoter family protein [Emticicia sp. 21SJ11W-3]